MWAIKKGFVSLRRILTYMYYLCICAAAVMLIVLITAEEKTGTISIEQLLEGKMPAQNENLTELSGRISSIPDDISLEEVFFGVNSKLKVSGGKADWNLTNPHDSSFIIHMEVVSEDGKRVFSSGAIPPGSKLEAEKLMKQLEEGEYACTAYVFAYDTLTFAYQGGFTLPMQITVL